MARIMPSPPLPPIHPPTPPPPPLPFGSLRCHSCIQPQPTPFPHCPVFLTFLIRTLGQEDFPFGVPKAEWEFICQHQMPLTRQTFPALWQPSTLENRCWGHPCRSMSQRTCRSHTCGAWEKGPHGQHAAVGQQGSMQWGRVGEAATVPDAGLDSFLAKKNSLPKWRENGGNGGKWGSKTNREWGCSRFCALENCPQGPAHCSPHGARRGVGWELMVGHQF